MTSESLLDLYDNLVDAIAEDYDEYDLVHCIETQREIQTLYGLNRRELALLLAAAHQLRCLRREPRAAWSKLAHIH